MAEKKSVEMKSDPKAVEVGHVTAIQVILRSLFSTHPNPQALRRAFIDEHRSQIGLFMLQGASSQALDAYRDYLGAVLPDPSDPADVPEEQRDSVSL